MLKLYSDKTWQSIAPNHVVMQYPFWGPNPEDPHDVSRGRFDRYADAGMRFFQMTPLAEADLAVVPCSWETIMDQPPAVRRAEQFIAHARQPGKRTVIFFWSDSDAPIDIDGVIVFRTSLYRSKRKRNEFAMPAWGEDFVGKYLGGQLPVRQKRTPAVVGFCGFTPSLQSRYAPGGSEQDGPCIPASTRKKICCTGEPMLPSVLWPCAR
jgi:hypothetical protein